MLDQLLRCIQSRATDPTTRIDFAHRSVPEVNPIVSDLEIEAAQVRLGFRLPSLLARVYTEIGNGGFGPGYGLLRLFSKDVGDRETALGLYELFRSDLEAGWPVHFLPISDWGCVSYTCVDCSSDVGGVFTFDWNDVNSPYAGFAQTHPTLADWFSDWVVGHRIWDLMFEPDTQRPQRAMNPFTREPFTIFPRRLRPYRSSRAVEASNDRHHEPEL